MTRAFLVFALLALASLALVACPRAAPPPELAPRAIDDDSTELASQLPRGADHCAVARVGRLSSRQRAMVRPIASAGELAWYPGVPFSVHAAAGRTDLDGLTATVSLSRLTVAPGRAREALQRDSPVLLRFPGDQSSRRHAMEASFVSENVLRIEKGRWPEGMRAGVEGHCVRLLRRYPDALEVSSREGRSVILGRYEGVPVRVDTVLLPSRTGVTRVEREHMASVVEAEEREAAGVEELLEESPDRAAFADRIERYRSGVTVVRRLVYLWEDLGMLLDDDARQREAAALEAQARQLIPADRVDVRDEEQFLEQERLRRERLSSLDGSARMEAAEQLRTLLARAFAERLEDAGVARRLVRLLLDELADGPGAGAIVARVLATNPDDREGWRVLGREAAARISDAALAEALAADGVVPEVEAAPVAARLRTLTGDGVAYEQAEGACVAARVLAAIGGRRAPSPVAEVRLPLRSLLGSLATILAGSGGSPHAAYALVEGQVHAGSDLSWDPDWPRLMVVEPDPARPTLLAQFVTGRDARVPLLEGQLADVMADGPAEVRAMALSFNADLDSPGATLRLQGRIEGGAFVLERTAAMAGQLPWARVVQLIAEPLLTIEPRVFPPPSVDVLARDEQEAARLLAHAQGAGGARCRREELRIRCDAPAEDPEGIYAVVQQIAREERLVLPASGRPRR